MFGSRHVVCVALAGKSSLKGRRERAASGLRSVLAAYKAAVFCLAEYTTLGHQSVLGLHFVVAQLRR